MPDEGPKIIIDEGWKERVQREKEQTVQEPDVAPQAEETEEGGPRKASFDTLLGAMVTEAMFSLGLIAPNGNNEVMIDLDHAQFMIDTLIVLRDKTAGNLTAEEEGALKESIARLQNYYVAIMQYLQEQEMQRAGINLQDFRQP